MRPSFQKHTFWWSDNYWIPMCSTLTIWLSNLGGLKSSFRKLSSTQTFPWTVGRDSQNMVVKLFLALLSPRPPLSEMTVPCLHEAPEFICHRRWLLYPSGSFQHHADILSPYLVPRSRQSLGPCWLSLLTCSQRVCGTASPPYSCHGSSCCK